MSNTHVLEEIFYRLCKISELVAQNSNCDGNQFLDNDTSNSNVY